MKARGRVGVMAAGYAVAAMILLAACVQQSGTQPVLSSSDLVATWVSPVGGSISFASDHRFTTSGLRLGKYWGGCAKTGRISAAGTWQFLSPQGDSGVNPTGYSKGSLIDLSFDQTPGPSPIDCIGGAMTLTSWNLGSARGLCVAIHQG